MAEKMVLTKGKKQQKNEELNYMDIINEDTLTCMCEDSIFNILIPSK